MPRLSQISNYMDELLEISSIKDISSNGVQIANEGDIAKIAMAVDLNLYVIQKAIEEKASLILVHHGIFWGKPFPITGRYFDILKSMISNDIALYAVHLPLDRHPLYGNNIGLAKVISLTEIEGWGDYHGQSIGFKGKMQKAIHRNDILKLYENDLNFLPAAPKPYYFGNEKVSTVCICSGNGGHSLHDDYFTSDMDLFITGEPSHEIFSSLEDQKRNVLYLGHYASETYGVRLLGKHIAEQFGLDSVFISHNSNL